MPVSNSQLNAWAQVPFANQAEMVEAMRDPRYRDSMFGAAYVHAVEQKIALTDEANQAGRSRVIDAPSGAILHDSRPATFNVGPIESATGEPTLEELHQLMRKHLGPQSAPPPPPSPDE